MCDCPPVFDLVPLASNASLEAPRQARQRLTRSPSKTLLGDISTSIDYLPVHALTAVTLNEAPIIYTARLIECDT
jgi:hypothetical protein